MVDLIKYTGLTGLSGSIFSLVDITGLFLFYDITYCIDLMNKMRWNKLASMTYCRRSKVKLVCDLKSRRRNVIMQVVFPAAVIVLVPVH